jgi:hypothetical protein
MSNGNEIKGFWDPKFDKVIDIFEENFEMFEEIGASLAVTVNGKFMIDIWAGYADAQTHAARGDQAGTGFGEAAENLL